MTVRDWISSHPEAIIVDGMIGEGYGDGWLTIENALDEEIRNVYYNEATKEAEIYI